MRSRFVMLLLFSTVAHGDPLGLPMQRIGSGTAWQPDDTPMFAHHIMAGDWMVMVHYSLQGGFDHQSSARGDDRGYGLGWVMGMASHDLLGGELTVRAMLSPEPIFDGKRGYPLLLQSGEEVGGEALHDRQHPHDLFMELAVMYAHPLTSDLAVFVYGGPSAEPALGPVAFPHRIYGIYDMVAALGHHWMDSTHVSFGVVTAGLYTRWLKLEGSVFNGREPDEDRYDFDFRGFDSWSARLSASLGPTLSAQVSFGHLDSPEKLEPMVSVDRLTASVAWDLRLGDGRNFSALLAYGRDAPSEGDATNALLLEGTAQPWPVITFFGRLEWNQKSGEDLSVDGTHSFTTVSLGAVHEFPALAGIVPGVGVRGTVSFLGADLEPTYGTRTPVGFFGYLEVHPAAMP